MLFEKKTICDTTQKIQNGICMGQKPKHSKQNDLHNTNKPKKKSI